MKLLFALLLVTATSAMADDATALKIFAEAKTIYTQRLENGKVDEALTKLADALTQAESTEVKYDILIQTTRAYYFKGALQARDADKMAVYELGMSQAKAAQALDESYAEAHYYYSINLGKWSLAKGVLASLSRKKELMDAAEAAKERLTRNGDMGETFDDYGPSRTLGRMYFKLPGFAGGDREKSIELLTEAVEKGTGTVLNSVYLAETLASGSAEEKASARQILDTVLGREISSFNPDKLPETTLELAEAKELRRQLGN